MILTYPKIPPSINTVYKVNRRTGALYMDSSAKAYKEEFAKYARENWISQIHGFNTEAVYYVGYSFFFPREELINEKYGKDKRIKSRYKKFDVDNMVKLLQDCVSYTFGFNDSHIFSFAAEKTLADKRYVEIKISEIVLPEDLRV